MDTNKHFGKNISDHALKELKWQLPNRVLRRSAKYAEYIVCVNFEVTNPSQLHAGANLLPVEASKQELLAAQDYKVLQKVFERLDKKKDGKIDKDELLEYLLRVKYEPVKVNQYGVSEVEHM